MPLFPELLSVQLFSLPHRPWPLFPLLFVCLSLSYVSFCSSILLPFPSLSCSLSGHPSRRYSALSVYLHFSPPTSLSITSYLNKEQVRRERKSRIKEKNGRWGKPRGGGRENLETHPISLISVGCPFSLILHYSNFSPLSLVSELNGNVSSPGTSSGK